MKNLGVLRDNFLNLILHRVDLAFPSLQLQELLVRLDHIEDVFLILFFLRNFFLKVILTLINQPKFLFQIIQDFLTTVSILTFTLFSDDARASPGVDGALINQPDVVFGDISLLLLVQSVI